MKINKDSTYIKFVKKGLELAKDLPRYFSKFSNKIFCNHQKIVLLVLKQKMRTTYRDLIELLKITSIPDLIGLKKIPHHTTLVKFAKKIKPKLLNFLLPYRKAKIVGLDGTGFEVNNKSKHYQMRTKDFSYRRYVKTGISIDTEKQLILTNTIHKSPRNDCIDLPLLAKNLQAKEIIADKGYDSKKNRNFVIQKLRAIPIIPKRCHTNFYGYLKQRKKIDGKNYHQRSKVETVFSVIKRKYGSALRSKSFAMQKKEVICKLIAYNLDRLILYFIRGFQHSPFIKTILNQRKLYKRELHLYNNKMRYNMINETQKLAYMNNLKLESFRRINKVQLKDMIYYLNRECHITFKKMSEFIGVPISTIQSWTTKEKQDINR